MITAIDANEARSIQNKEAVLGLYDMMINQKKAPDAAKKYLHPDYIQHNPLIPTGAESLGAFFGQVAAGRPNLRVVVHKVIAAGDYVWAHVNFLNLYNDDPNDRGIAGVDIYRFDSNGKMVEHWDTLQEVPDPKKSANTNGMF
jgi:predicted SnoaL-like aldol condensation-catalyzing enzyme